MTTEQRSGEPVFRWTSAPENGAHVVSLAGEFDMASVGPCTDAFPQWVSAADRVLILDLSRLEFADSTALRFLVDLKRHVDAAGKMLALRDVSEVVLRLFEMAGLTQWFDYIDGHGPTFTTCPLCNGEVLDGSSRCYRCGGAL
jgi:anti-sigma B factor antagonist